MVKHKHSLANTYHKVGLLHPVSQQYPNVSVSCQLLWQPAISYFWNTHPSWCMALGPHTAFFYAAFYVWFPCLKSQRKRRKNVLISYKVKFNTRRLRWSKPKYMTTKRFCTCKNITWKKETNKKVWTVLWGKLNALVKHARLYFFMKKAQMTYIRKIKDGHQTLKFSSFERGL
jgi:hypothetical protein